MIEIKSLGHGANVCEMAALYEKESIDIIDFSSNINPYTVPGLEDFLEDALSAAVSYPDSQYTRLREEIAKYVGCMPYEVIPGNGATEIMYLLMKSLSGTIGIFNPTFSEYERGAHLNGLEVIDLHLNKEKGFTVDLDALKERLDEIDSVFVCNPNNPTGNVQDLKELLEVLSATGKLLIVDETFMEFVPEEERYSLVPMIKAHRNLIVIKAMTKFFGLPGLRLGYGVTSNTTLLEKMYVYKEPWTINTFAEKLSIEMFKETEYKVESKAYFEEEREAMLEALGKMQGLKAYGTATNFILIELEKIKASKLKEGLFVDYNILIRDASNFKGLNENFVRVAIKTPEENAVLIDAMSKILGGIGRDRK